MPGSIKHPCQAVIVRFAPDTSSGELLNIGVVLLSPGHRFMASRFLDKWSRLTQAFPEADAVHLRRIASAIERSCEKHYEGEQLTLVAPTSAIDLAFDAALPRDDAAILRSAPLTGLTADPERTLNELFGRYVAVRDPSEQRVTRNDENVWRSVSTALKARNVLARLSEHTVRGRRYERRFDHAWKNGRWNVAQALSFDLVDPSEIVNKAANWSGRIAALDAAKDVEFHLIVGMPQQDAPAEVRAAAEDAVGILKDQLEATERAHIVPENDADALADRIVRDLESHAAAE